MAIIPTLLAAVAVVVVIIAMKKATDLAWLAKWFVVILWKLWV